MHHAGEHEAKLTASSIRLAAHGHSVLRRLAIAIDLDRQRGPWPARLYCPVELLQPHRRAVVQFDDQIPLAQPGPVGGGVGAQMLHQDRRLLRPPHRLGKLLIILDARSVQDGLQDRYLLGQHALPADPPALRRGPFLVGRAAGQAQGQRAQHKPR